MQFTKIYILPVCFLLIAGCHCPESNAAQSSRIDTAPSPKLILHLETEKLIYSGLNDKINVKLIFHNNTEHNINLAVGKNGFKNRFFDYILLGDDGDNITIDNARFKLVGPTDVEVHKLPKNKKLKFAIENVINLSDWDSLTAYKKKTCYLYAVFRDYKFAYINTSKAARQASPELWTGTLMSNPVKIQIENE